MEDLVQWLGEQLDEDERTARRVESSWRQIGETGVIVASDGERAEECANGNWSGIAEHIACHDPARVLREVDAKRRIVERYAWLREHGDTGGAAWVLPLLALPYADRPGYREDWRP